MPDMHIVSLTCTDATTPETVAATTELKIDDKKILGVRSCRINWEQNGLPTVVLKFHAGGLIINSGADTSLVIERGAFASENLQIRSIER